MIGLITLVVAYFSFSICISGKHKMTVSVLSPLANRSRSLLRRLLPPHPHVQKCADAGEDGAFHPGWLFLSGHRQTSDPGVAGCHLQLLREAKLPNWPFTSPASWDHAPSAVHGVLPGLATLMMERKKHIVANIISEGQRIIKYVQEAYNMLFTLSRGSGFTDFRLNSNFAET